MESVRAAFAEDEVVVFACPDAIVALASADGVGSFVAVDIIAACVAVQLVAFGGADAGGAAVAARDRVVARTAADGIVAIARQQDFGVGSANVGVVAAVAVPDRGVEASAELGRNGFGGIRTRNVADAVLVAAVGVGGEALGGQATGRDAVDDRQDFAARTDDRAVDAVAKAEVVVGQAVGQGDAIEA